METAKDNSTKLRDLKLVCYLRNTLVSQEGAGPAAEEEQKRQQKSVILHCRAVLGIQSKFIGQD